MNYLHLILILYVLFLSTSTPLLVLAADTSTSSSSPPKIEYTLKFHSNHNRNLVYIDGIRVPIKKSTNGLREIKITTCSDILFILKKNKQSISTALSAFLVHTGISPPLKSNIYATRHVIKGKLPSVTNPGTDKVAYTYQFDPDFNSNDMKPLFAYANPVNVYQNPPCIGNNGKIPIMNIEKEINLYIKDPSSSKIPDAFNDTKAWIAATPVDAVLTDQYEKFKPLFEVGALPLNWRDGFMRTGYYAIKICNPLCYADDRLDTVMNGCAANGAF